MQHIRPIGKAFWAMILLLAAQAAMVHEAAAATYYVSPTGNDSNLGSESAPWKTIQKAAQTITAGDIAYIRGGTYPENKITFAHSGTASNPIIIERYKNETPIIDGGFNYPFTGTAIPVFEIQGVDYITLSGLTIRRGFIANIRVAYDKPAKHITIQYCDLKEFVFSDNSANIYINNSGADNILITHNLIHHGQGIPTKLNNASGIILFSAKNVTIRNNEIYNTNNGIYYKHSIDDGSITLIENNRIYNQQAGGTGRGLKVSRSDVIMRNNVIYNSDLGVEVFEESATCNALISARNKIIHNTIVNVYLGIRLSKSILCEGAVDTIIRDNIIYNFSNTEYRGVSVWAFMEGSDESRTTLDHNLIFSSITTSPIRLMSSYYTVASPPSSFLGPPEGSLSVPPFFEDSTVHNYALAAGSPGKNGGSDGKDLGADFTSVGALTTFSQAPLPPADLKVSAN